MNLGPGTLYLNGRLFGKCIALTLADQAVSGESVDPQLVRISATPTIGLEDITTLVCPEPRRKKAQWKQRHYGPQQR